MKISDNGIAEIIAFEGLVLKAYPDPGTGGEPWTIGVGHTSAAGPPRVKKGMAITKEEAITILRRDLAVFERGVSEMVFHPITQGQFDAVVSFSFNVGLQNLKNSTLLKKVNAGDFEGAAREFRRWNKAAGRVLQGLVKRRAREEMIFRS